MGVINALIEKRSQSSDLTNPAEWLINCLGGLSSAAGVRVSEETSMRLTAVFACVRILAWTVASLPLPVYRRLKPRGKERAPDHPLYGMLHDQPNKEQTSFTFRSVSMAHLALWGNAYSEIEFARNGERKHLWPLPPWKVKPKRTKNNEKVFEINLPDGTTKILPDYRVIHVQGLGTDGLKGLSPIGMAKEGIGLGLAAEEFGARFFSQGANVGGVAEHPGTLGDEAFDRLRKSLNEKYEGLGQSHRLMLLEEGMKYQRVGIPPEEAQFIETRKFQLEEIARLYNVPLHLLQHHEKATSWGSGIEHLNIGFVMHSIRPYLVNWEQEFQRKLFDEDDHFAEFLIEGLLRGDLQSRYEAYTKGRQWGWLSANDVRELENQNPLPGEQGDIYLVPMNMVPADRVGEDEDTPEAITDLEPDENSTKNKTELRAGGARSRFNIANSYRRVFRDVASRIIRREKADVLRQADNLLNNRNLSAFREWLSDFYSKHREFVEKNMLPPLSSLAEAIESSVAEELDADTNSQEKIQRFLDDYNDTLARRYTATNAGNLLQVIEQAEEEGEDEYEALEQEFERWEDFRAEDVARNETVKLTGAVTRVAMAAAGVTKLAWRNTGHDTCEFCQELDGKVVGIESPFLADGDSITSDDGKMKVTGPKFHPPVHHGCVCTLESSD